MILRVLVCALCLSAPAFAAAPEPVYAENGLVVSASAEASEAGVQILRAGGNAVDAAVATGFALAVTHPAAGNIGGGFFLVARMADGRAFTIDAREKAPLAAHRDMFLDDEGNPDSELSLRSPFASGVPGSVDGLLKAWRGHGSGNIARRQLLAPAIRLARDGFTITHTFAEGLNARRAFFERDPGARKIFVRPEDDPWKQGDLLVQADLADTLERIARQGREGFYAGETADLLTSQMARSGGLITQRDLNAYDAKYREPVRGSFRNVEILSMGPPSSGGVLVVQMLNMLELYPLEDFGWNAAQYVHMLTEVQRRAYADRATHLGDMDFWPVPIERLTSKAYAKQRAATIDLDRATPSDDVSAGKMPPAESRETTHYSVVDKQGNAVAVTTTLNASYGSGILVDGAGFFLNNEMDDFSAKPGSPNLYGLIGGEANAIEPGKRMLSSMTPTIVVRDGAPYLVVGSPGGSTIINTVLHIILNTVVFDMDIQEAVSAPRTHSQWKPDEVVYERFGLSPDTQRILESKGHKLVQRESIGRANCIMIADDALYGAPDPRGGNAAAGY